MANTLNDKVDIVIKANSFLNPVGPKQGVIIIGDKGMEFLASTGSGFIQIPWINIELIRAQVYFRGKYIRGIDVYTDENQVLPFVISDGKAALRIAREYLGSEKLVKAKDNFAHLFKKNK